MSEASPHAERREHSRPSGSEAWKIVRRDAWRIEQFEAQIAFEAAERRDAANLRRSIMCGVAFGLAVSLVQAWP